MKNNLIPIVLLFSISCTTNPPEKQYTVNHIPQTTIKIDGILGEEEWAEAEVETGFLYPWENTAAPKTEFRALFSEADFYFSFKVPDDEIVVEDSINGEMDLIAEDRVEFYFTLDEQLSKYYCFEIDARARVLSYSSSIPRQFDFTWEWQELTTAAALTDEGYVVEGMIPLSYFQTLGFPVDSGDFFFRAAIFHTQFRRLPDGSIEEHWLSWIDPLVSEPDYHVPSSFGILMFKR